MVCGKFGSALYGIKVGAREEGFAVLKRGSCGCGRT